jgi:hypothetical protein
LVDVIGHAIDALQIFLELGRHSGSYETHLARRIEAFEHHIEPRIAALDHQILRSVEPFEGPSQPAQVRLLASNYRNTDPIDAKVETVSADLFMDPRNGERYYLARLQLSPLKAGHLDRANGSSSEHTQLTAGMPVEVMITTRPHSIIQYVLTPLTSAFRRSLKES